MEVGHGLFVDRSAGAEPSGQLRRESPGNQTGHRTEDQGQPHGLNPGFRRVLFSVCSHQSRHGGGGTVGKEHEHPDQRQGQRGTHPQPGQGIRAQLSDDRGVGHDEQGLGDQRREGGQGQLQDPAIQGMRHPAILGPGAPTSGPGRDVHSPGMKNFRPRPG